MYFKDRFRFVDSIDKFPMTGKGDFDIHYVHSYHVECVALLSRQATNE